MKSYCHKTQAWYDVFGERELASETTKTATTTKVALTKPTATTTQGTQTTTTTKVTPTKTTSTTHSVSSFLLNVRHWTRCCCLYVILNIQLTFRIKYWILNIEYFFRLSFKACGLVSRRSSCEWQKTSTDFCPKWRSNEASGRPTWREPTTTSPASSPNLETTSNISSTRSKGD